MQNNLRINKKHKDKFEVQKLTNKKILFRQQDTK